MLQSSTPRTGVKRQSRQKTSNKNKRRKVRIEDDNESTDSAVDADESDSSEAEAIDWKKLESVLEENAAKANLTAVNVKSILHHILVDKRVLEYAKTAADNDGSGSGSGEIIADHAKLTRSKAKLLGQQPLPIPDDNAEKPKFIDMDFHESSSSDDEYNPNEEDDTSQASDEDYLSTFSDAISDLQSPFIPKPHHTEDETLTESDVSIIVSPHQVTPIATSTKTSDQEPESAKKEPFTITKTSEQEPESAKKELFKVPNVPSKTKETEEDLISTRTRSRLPMPNIEVEEIAAMFEPPDSTALDFSVRNVDDPDEIIWKNWLSDFMKPIKALNDTADEDANDEDFNFMEAAAAEDTEIQTEEFRNDKATRITQKELQELFNGLLLDYNNDNQDIHTYQYCDESAPFQIEDIKPKITHDVIDAVKDCEVSYEQRRHIAAQIQQHTQLLTQLFLLSCTNIALRNEYTQCKLYIDELGKFHDKALLNSAQFIGNIKAENSMFCTPGISDACRIVSSLSGTKLATKVYKSSKNRYPLNDSIARLIASEPYFATYIELLPEQGMMPEKKNSMNMWHAPSRMKFSPTEDNLLALGLDQFRCKKDSQKFVLISEYLLPTKTPKQLSVRVKNLCCNRQNYQNPVTIVKKERYLPELTAKIKISVPREISTIPLTKIPRGVWKTKFLPFWFLNIYKKLQIDNLEKEEKERTENHKSKHSLFELALKQESVMDDLSNTNPIKTPPITIPAGLIVRPPSVSHIPISLTKYSNLISSTPGQFTACAPKVEVPARQCYSDPSYLLRQNVNNGNENISTLELLAQSKKVNRSLSYPIAQLDQPQMSHQLTGFSPVNENSAHMSHHSSSNSQFINNVSTQDISTNSQVFSPSVSPNVINLLTNTNSCIPTGSNSNVETGSNNTNQPLNSSNISHDLGFQTSREKAMNVNESLSQLDVAITNNSGNTNITENTNELNSGKETNYAISTPTKSNSTDNFNLPVPQLLKDLPSPKSCSQFIISPSKPLHETSFSEVKLILKTPQKVLKNTDSQLLLTPNTPSFKEDDMNVDHNVSGGDDSLENSQQHVISLLDPITTDDMEQYTAKEQNIETDQRNGTLTGDEVKKVRRNIYETKTEEVDPFNEKSQVCDNNQNDCINQNNQEKARDSGSQAVSMEEQGFHAELDKQLESMSPMTQSKGNSLQSPDGISSLSCCSGPVLSDTDEDINLNDQDKNEEIEEIDCSHKISDSNPEVISNIGSKKGNLRKKTLKQKKQASPQDVFDYDKKLKQKAQMFANIYFKRVREVLADVPELCQKFFMLLESVNDNCLTKLDVYHQVSQLLVDYPELVDNYAGFLEQHEARHVGKFFEWLVYDQIVHFHLSCEQHFFNVPGWYQKINQKLIDIVEKEKDPNLIVESITPMFRGNQNLTNQFIRIFPDLPPPMCDDDDFEVIDFAAVQAGLKDIDDFEDISFQQTDCDNIPLTQEESKYRKKRLDTKNNNLKFLKKKSNTNIAASKLRQLATKRKKKTAALQPSQSLRLSSDPEIDNVTDHNADPTIETSFEDEHWSDAHSNASEYEPTNINTSNNSNTIECDNSEKELISTVHQNQSDENEVSQDNQTKKVNSENFTSISSKEISFKNVLSAQPANENSLNHIKITSIVQPAKENNSTFANDTLAKDTLTSQPTTENSLNFAGNNSPVQLVNENNLIFANITSTAQSTNENNLTITNNTSTAQSTNENRLNFTNNTSTIQPTNAHNLTLTNNTSTAQSTNENSLNFTNNTSTLQPTNENNLNFADDTSTVQPTDENSVNIGSSTSTSENSLNFTNNTSAIQPDLDIARPMSPEIDNNNDSTNRNVFDLFKNVSQNTNSTNGEINESTLSAPEISKYKLEANISDIPIVENTPDNNTGFPSRNDSTEKSSVMVSCINGTQREDINLSDSRGEDKVNTLNFTKILKVDENVKKSVAGIVNVISSMYGEHKDVKQDATACTFNARSGDATEQGNVSLEKTEILPKQDNASPVKEVHTNKLDNVSALNMETVHTSKQDNNALNDKCTSSNAALSPTSTSQSSYIEKRDIKDIQPVLCIENMVINSGNVRSISSDMSIEKSFDIDFAVVPYGKNKSDIIEISSDTQSNGILITSNTENKNVKESDVDSEVECIMKKRIPNIHISTPKVKNFSPVIDDVGLLQTENAQFDVISRDGNDTITDIQNMEEHAGQELTFGAFPNASSSTSNSQKVELSVHNKEKSIHTTCELTFPSNLNSLNEKDVDKGTELSFQGKISPMKRRLAKSDIITIETKDTLTEAEFQSSTEDFASIASKFNDSTSANPTNLHSINSIDKMKEIKDLSMRSTEDNNAPLNLAYVNNSPKQPEEKSTEPHGMETQTLSNNNVSLLSGVEVVQDHAVSSSSSMLSTAHLNWHIDEDRLILTTVQLCDGNTQIAVKEIFEKLKKKYSIAEVKQRLELLLQRFDDTDDDDDTSDNEEDE